MGSTGSEQTTTSSENQHIASQCDAKCDAISADRVELLAQAVILVAGMAIPEAVREAVLARVVADLASYQDTAAPGRESYGHPAT